mmetsp:Transcript_9671/g.22237  ORF Transcript_9671/g.22237 Transcript_9671/m.22237 type:complete len:133 (+) Transcript_9671:2-400(+)
MRVANSMDVLEQRPDHRPAPPRGFTTRRVLGPSSDLKTVRPKKRRRRGPDRRGGGGGGGGSGGSGGGSSTERHYEHEFNPNTEEDHPALSRGLRSERAGYSLEEMNAERQQQQQQQQQNSVIRLDQHGFPIN